MSQYFFPAIIYRDIISHITNTYRYIMYFFRTFKKSTAPYKVHNMGLRYIKSINYSNSMGGGGGVNVRKIGKWGKNVSREEKVPNKNVRSYGKKGERRTKKSQRQT